MEVETFEYKVTILEHHLDSFGHVNNAVYFELYEQARWDFITKNEYGLEKVSLYKKGPVILEVNCRYKREIKNREKITITSETLLPVSKVMKLKQRMIKEDGTLASEAVFTIGLMDMEKRRLVEPTSEWKRAIGIK